MNIDTFMKRAQELSPFVSWAKVAKRAGYSENTVSKYVNGLGGNLETMQRIIDAANSEFSALKSSINSVPQFQAA